MARALVFALLIVVVLGAAPRPAWSTCNVIPGATDIFRGALGSTDRPFAMPGDVVEVSLRPEVCDGPSSALIELPGGTTAADDYRVTVLFTPPQGPRNAVVLATDCSKVTPANLTACETQLGAMSEASCIQANTALNPNALRIHPDRLRLAFRFPDTDDVPGAPTEGGANDDNTFAGPAKIVVTSASGALPCQIASQRCASATGLIACVDELFQQDGSCRTGVNDVDGLFGHFTALPPPNDFSALVTSPGTTTARFTIDEAGNALVPMDWQAVLVRQGDVPFPRLVQGGSGVDSFTLVVGNNVIDIPSDRFIGSFSPEGIPLPPIFQPISDPDATSEATLFGATDAPLGVLRVARRLPVVAACSAGANAGRPCDLATDCPDASCVELPAFEYRQCTSPANRPCLQDSDCDGGTCGSAVCYADAAATATPCATDTDCAGLGGECGPSLFDFADRFDPGIGPVLLTPGLYSVQQQTPVALDGQRQTPDLFAFVVPEGLGGQDLNGDGDTSDLVTLLRDRTTGAVQDTGPGGETGHPGVPALDPLPLRPRSVSLATEGEIAAFLRSEPLEGPCTTTPLFCDVNGDGDSTDGLLTVLRIGQGPVYPTPPVAADPSLEIDGQNVAVSDGLVFFRTAEADNVGRSTVLVSVSSGGVQANAAAGGSPAISADGRYVAFASTADNLDSTPPDTNGASDVFVHDRDADADGAFDPPGQVATRRVSLTTAGAEVAAGILNAGMTLTASGRFVGFSSWGAFVPGDTNGLVDAYVRDRDTEQTVLVSALPSGLPANGSSLTFSVTPDGRFVVFRSDATDLVAGDTNGVLDIFVRDRDTNKNGIFDEPGFVAVVRASVAGDGTQANGAPVTAEISDDGRYVAFDSQASNLVPGDTNGVRDVFVRDRDADADGIFDEPGAATTVRVSVSTAGDQGNDASPGLILWPQAFSASGRFVYFDSLASNLVAGDTNGVLDAFVRDRDTDQNGVMDEPGAVATRRVSVRSDGTQETTTGALAFGAD